MTDFRRPYDPHGEAQDFYNPRAQYAGVALMLLAVVGIAVASFYSAKDTQITSNRPAVETTGSGGAISP